MQTHHRISADGWLGVLELLLHTGHGSLAICADKSSQNEFGMNGMSPDNLARDSRQAANFLRSQIPNLDLGVDLREGNVILLQTELNQMPLH